MSKKKEDSFIDQLSFSDLLNMLDNRKNNLSSNDLSEIINKLSVVKNEKETAEQRKKEQEERKRREVEEREKQKREKEHVEKVTSMDLPLDWENAFNNDPRATEIHAECIADGLIYSLSNLGKVDIEYISSITGSDYKTVITTLKGSIYQNPETWDECFYKGWETSEEYLSGNIMRKWKLAKKADEKYKGYFLENIKAIEKILPPSIATKDIYVTLGSPWVPPDIIDDFIMYLLGDWKDKIQEFSSYKIFKTRRDEYTGTWEVPFRFRYKHDSSVMRTYGTNRINSLYILEKTLNMKSVVITDEVVCNANLSGKKKVINQSETILALEKQKNMIKEFQEWVWKDKKRKERLEAIFDDNFSCVRKRTFDGSFLKFPQMSKNISLYPYQQNAVARILFSPNTLLAHDVGTGKTYVMVAAGMEMRRMGLSTKNMYVVPNNIVGQWKDIFITLYPSAKILSIEPKDFKASKRESVLEIIRDEDFDGIIIAYSCFEQIPLSKAYYQNALIEERDQIAKIVENENKATSRLRRKRDAVAKALSELTVAINDMYNRVYFDDLGITRLFVDEAHNFKNVPFDTKADKILGINPKGSKKCQDMMDKVQMIQKQNNGAGVVFATGTPITNSITDAFIMQKYLQSGELAMLELQSFDSWIGMFAERNTEFEIDVDTNSYRLATRFSKFHNLPELTSLLSSIADFHQVDSSSGIPKTDGYNDALVSKTDELADYLKDISLRAEDVRKGYVYRTDDNMLKITTDGRKAALDLRLVDPFASFTYQSKVMRCAENVATIYFETIETKSAQIIFCDTSTPKKGFNIYDEVKRLILQQGVPENEIAFVHEANTEIRRNKLFEKVRNGDIRILLGSTFKLGLGVNIQDRLIALHHLDVPWRPADMTQREGRILRQGNQNSKVQIFRYITEGSFDAYSWQLLETKERFIAGLLSGSITQRSGTDIEDTVLNYAQVKALAVGNPLVKMRVETANELSRYITLQQKLVENKIDMKKELMGLPGQIENQKENIEKCKADIDSYNKFKSDNGSATDTKTKKADAEKRKSLRKYIHKELMEHILEPQEKVLTTYCGFEIILPANMIVEKPYIWLKREGRYYIEVGNSDVGCLIRIDNFLDDLPKHFNKLQKGLDDLQKKECEIKKELSKKESFSDEIEKYRQKLKTIDKKLGVDTN